MKLALDRCKIDEDIGMIELQVVQYRSAGAVMNELRALVEEGGVVLVSLYDEERRAGEAGRNREIQWHAADQEPGEAACLLQDPRQHGCDGGLSMGACHGQYMPAAEYLLGQPLRPRNIPLSVVENCFHQGVAARDDVADDPSIGPQRQLPRVEAFGKLDAERRELLAHRRIDVGIAAGNTVSRGLGDGGKAAHERAANAEDMKMRRHGIRAQILFDGSLRPLRYD